MPGGATDMNIISVTGRSEQFTTVAGEVVPERIVPASISVNLAAVAAIVIALVAIGSR